MKAASRLPLAGTIVPPEAQKPVPNAMSWTGTLRKSFLMMGSVNLTVDVFGLDPSCRESNDFLRALDHQGVKITIERLPDGA